MKVDFETLGAGAAVHMSGHKLIVHVVSETDILTDVLLCPPNHLSPVPCCAVTRHHIGHGFATCTDQALEQHGRLVDVLRKHGVRTHMLPPDPDLPDMCFTRDGGVATPWGMAALNPAMPHRRGEVDALAAACARWSIPIRRITQGTIEGGDVCVARDGLLILGMSGERSSTAGIEEFAAPFRADGWDVVICPFHADHLHLDTIFCMIDADQAIGCIELLDPGFVQALGRHGISILPMPATMAVSLGCNILSLGEQRILISDDDGPLAPALRERGYDVKAIDISQFAACGGGIHCLTQPLRRIAH